MFGGGDWGDRDDDDVKRTLQDQRDDVRFMIRFAQENNRQDVVTIGEEVEQLIDDCIELEENITSLDNENEALSTDNNDTKKKLQEELDKLNEQEKEIDKELEDVNKRLEAARNAKPPDPNLIAELEKQKNELVQMKQAIIADRENLNRAQQQTNQISNRCDRVRELAAPYSRGPSSGIGHDSRGGQGFDSRSGQSNYGNSGGEKAGGQQQTPHQACNSHLMALGILRQEMTQLKADMSQARDAITQLHSDNKAQLQDVKNNLNSVSENTQSRSDRLSEMRAKRAQMANANDDSNLEFELDEGTDTDHKQPVMDTIDKAVPNAGDAFENDADNIDNPAQTVTSSESVTSSASVSSSESAAQDPSETSGNKM